MVRVHGSLTRKELQEEKGGLRSRGSSQEPEKSTGGQPSLEKSS